MPGRHHRVTGRRWPPAGPAPGGAAAALGVPKSRDRPGVRQQAADGAQQGRLAGAVGPDHGDPLAARPRSGRRRAGSACRPARRAGRPPRRRRAGARRRLMPVTSPAGWCAAPARRTAPPRNAVTTPIGHLGRGARRSGRPGRPGPGRRRRTASTAAGSPGSSTPASSRTVCGTMMPTKPISPDDRDRRRGAQRGGGDQQVAGPLRVQAEARRLVVADRRARPARGGAAAPPPW